MVVLLMELTRLPSREPKDGWAAETAVGDQHRPRLFGAFSRGSNSYFSNRDAREAVGPTVGEVDCEEGGDERFNVVAELLQAAYQW